MSSRHRAGDDQPATAPVPVEIVEDPPTRGQRLRRIVSRAGLLVLFLVFLIVVLTLIRELSYTRGLLSDQIRQGEDAVRVQQNLLDQVEEQGERIDALTEQLRGLGVQPVGALPETAGSGEGTTPAVDAGTPSALGNTAGTPTGTPGAARSPAAGAQPSAPARQPEPSSPPGTGPPPATIAPAAPSSPSPAPTVPVDPCLLGLPGVGCVLQLPGVGVDLGALLLLLPAVPAGSSARRPRRPFTKRTRRSSTRRKPCPP